MLYLQEDAPEEHRVWEKANPLAQDGGAFALNQQQQHGAYVCSIYSYLSICLILPPHTRKQRLTLPPPSSPTKQAGRGTGPSRTS